MCKCHHILWVSVISHFEIRCTVQAGRQCLHYFFYQLINMLHWEQNNVDESERATFANETGKSEPTTKLLDNLADDDGSSVQQWRTPPFTTARTFPNNVRRASKTRINIYIPRNRHNLPRFRCKRSRPYVNRFWTRNINCKWKVERKENGRKCLIFFFQTYLFSSSFPVIFTRFPGDSQRQVVPLLCFCGTLETTRCPANDPIFTHLLRSLYNDVLQLNIQDRRS